MRTKKKIPARFGRETRFEVKPAVATFRVTQETELERQIDSLDHLRPGREPFPIEAQDLTGNKFSLAALKGKVVVLDFWATHCIPCMDEMPNLVKLNREFKDKGLEIVGINLDPNKDKLLQAINKAGITWTTIPDGLEQKFPIGQQFRIETIPSIFVINRKGVISAVDLRGEELHKAVAKLIEEKP